MTLGCDGAEVIGFDQSQLKADSTQGHTAFFPARLCLLLSHLKIMHNFSQLFSYKCVRPSIAHYAVSDPFVSHPWAHVVIGMWHKYPNSHCSHVITVDVVDRSVDPKTGIIRTERILGCKQKAPVMISKVRCSPPSPRGAPLTHHLLRQLFGGSDDAFVREVSFVDPATQQATITSVNMSLSQFATCNEFIRYSPAPDGTTRFSQTAQIQSRMAIWRSVSDRVERFLVQRFEQNAELGKMGFSDVLQRLWEGRQQLQHA